MGRKHKSAGRGSQMLDKVKRGERDVGSDASSSVPSTSGSSHERIDRSHPSGSHEKSYRTTSPEKAYPSTSPEKAYPSTSSEKSYPSTSPEKAYPSTSHEKAYPSTSHEKAYPSTSHEKSSMGSFRRKYEAKEQGEKVIKKKRIKDKSAYEVGSAKEPSSRDPERESTSKEPAKETAPVGRGQFLTQLAQQSKYKSSSEPGGSREVPPSKESSFRRKKGEPLHPKLPAETEFTEAEPTAPVVRLGETGQKVKMQCNYITLRTTPGKGIFEYEVKFEPPVANVRTRYRLIYKNIPVKKGIQCYDGVYRLFLPEAVEKNIVAVGECPQEKTPITITATFKRQVRSEECGTFYNILLNNCAKVLNLTRLGRHHYDSNANLHIPQHKLEVWPGYVTSVEEFEGGIHLCCDIKHRILRTDTAYDVLSQIFRADPNNFKNKAAKELLGQCILTRYNNHMYRIDDISWTETPLSTFPAKGQQVSYVDYYKTQYNITIKDVRQPLLIHIPKAKSNIPQICLIPELSHMTGLTDAMRRDMKVMKEVAAYTRITPAQREYSLKRFVENIHKNSTAQEMLDNWGLQICSEPVLVNGRILPPEDIFFRNERVESSETSDWLKFVRKQGVLRSVDIANWLMLFSARDRRLAEMFLRALQETGPNLGIRINDPYMITLKDDRIESYIRSLKENIRPKTQIVLCLCSTPREDRYSAIKKLCCLEIPVPSQIVNCGTIARENRLRVVAQNVALQMNNKLGGASWALNVPLKNCMICGIDTYHDTEKRGNSVGAFVASIDSRYTHWFSQVCVQEPKQELLHGLAVCFAAALQKYHSVNNKLPDRIVIFRDGVSDGHLKYVQNIEVQQFLEACKLAEDYTPKFSYVVVQKRINTKFYLSKRDQLENPKPGSILDHTITRRNYYDFFLVSQHVSCGTATPSHYIVLYDNSDLKPDYMQRLTYKFCHMYYNWPGTIRVPAPCQYAHKLAFLVGQNIKKQFDASLRDKLFYL